MKIVNHRHLPLFVGAAVCLLATVPTVIALGKPPKLDSQTALVRPDPAPEPDATGSLRIRSQNGFERIDVKAQKVDMTQQHDLFMEDPANQPTMVLLTGLVAAGKTLNLTLDTKKGDTLPLGVTSLAQLIGMQVEIRLGSGDVVLQGTVPSWDLLSKPTKAAVIVIAPDGAPAPDMSAKLSLRSKGNKGQERIDLKAKGVPWTSGPFRVFIEDPAGNNTFTDVGSLDQVAKAAGRFTRDTRHGQALPLGVTFVADLANRTLEVRDGNGVVYLRGLIPAVK